MRPWKFITIWQALFLTAVSSVIACSDDEDSAGTGTAPTASVTADISPATDVDLNFSMTTTACAGPEDCDPSAIGCAAGGTQKCVKRAGFAMTTCSYAPKGTSARVTCPCFEGAFSFCYKDVDGASAKLGIRSCIMTSANSSAWGDCVSLDATAAAAP